MTVSKLLCVGKGANGQSLYGTQDAQDDNRTGNRECESASWISSNQDLVDCTEF